MATDVAQLSTVMTIRATIRPRLWFAVFRFACLVRSYRLAMCAMEKLHVDFDSGKRQWSKSIAETIEGRQ